MDSSRIVNTYAADGTKLRSVYKTNAATLLFPIGHLCEQEQVEYAIRTVDYCGGVRYEHDGTYQNTIVYNTEGYYSQADSAFFAYQKDYQGNIVQVWNVTTGELVQCNEYYADGTPTPRTIGEEAQPYKYTGNEWIRTNGYDAYDFNARQFQPTLLRFDRPDPLAEKYYEISPYAFCGGNFVNRVDPTGCFFTDRAWDFVNDYIKDIFELMSNSESEIAKQQEKANNATTEKERKRAESKIRKYEAKKTACMSALMEISTLASSDQGYDIQINTDRNTKDAIFSQAYYNADNGLVTVDLGSHDMANVAHELLHCYQFEMGEANLGIKTNNDFNVQDVRITPQNLFDKTDEVAAYRRGSYFGEMERYSINSLPNIYKSLPSEHRNKHNTKPFSYGINNPYEYQRIATKTNSAYRINNVTYHP